MAVACWRIEKFGQNILYKRVLSHYAGHVALVKVKAQTSVVSSWLRIRILQFWLVSSRKVEVRRKTEGPQLVSVVAIGSGRPASFASCETI